MFIVSFRKKTAKKNGEIEDVDMNGGQDKVNLQHQKNSKEGEEESFRHKWGVHYVRGCTIQHINKHEELRQSDSKFKRSINVLLDPIQYKMDIDISERTTADEADRERNLYDNKFNMVFRRKSKENNFKAILDTIKSLMEEEELSVPEWFEEIFIGYDDPNKVTAFGQFEGNGKLPVENLDLSDTFVDEQHFKSSFVANKHIPLAIREKVQVPSRLIEEEKENKNSKTEGYRYDELERHVMKRASRGSSGPSLINRDLKFTERQVESIVSGLLPGLTLVEGPPGTGKTDVAVQIISLLLKNFPNERILLVTHSNQALNDLFEKTLKAGVNERYLIRLGMGEKGLQTLGKDFSRQGRIDYLLGRRLLILEEVRALAYSVGIHNFEEFTCESALYLFEFELRKRWDAFENSILPYERHKEFEDYDVIVKKNFPFSKYAAMKLGKRFKGLNEEAEKKIKQEREEAKKRRIEEKRRRKIEQKSKLGYEIEEEEEEEVVEEDPEAKLRTAEDEVFVNKFEIDVRKARNYWSFIDDMFKEVAECHSLELIRDQKERGNFLITQQAKVIAMTCTHAGLKRKELAAIGISF